MTPELTPAQTRVLAGLRDRARVHGRHGTDIELVNEAMSAASDQGHVALYRRLSERLAAGATLKDAGKREGRPTALKGLPIKRVAAPVGPGKGGGVAANGRDTWEVQDLKLPGGAHVRLHYEASHGAQGYFLMDGRWWAVALDRLNTDRRDYWSLPA